MVREEKEQRQKKQSIGYINNTLPDIVGYCINMYVRTERFNTIKE